MKRLSRNQILILGLMLFALCLILVVGGGFIFFSISQNTMPTISVLQPQEKSTQPLSTQYIPTISIQTLAPAPPNVSNILLENGFVRDPTYDSTCTTPCETYVNRLYLMQAQILKNGEFGMAMESDSSINPGTQGQILGSVVSVIYSPNVAHWISNNLTGLNGSREGRVDNYFVSVQSTVASDGITIIISVEIMPIG